MKILLIITKAEVGGAQKSVLNLASSFKEMGINVSIGTGENSGFLSDFARKNKINTFVFKNLARTKNPLKNLFFIFEIKRFVDKNDFDILHFNSSNTLFGAIGSKLSKKKIKNVFTFRGMSMLDPNYQVLKIVKLFYINFFRLMMFFIDYPVFVSKQNEEMALAQKITKKGLTIYNGINEEKLYFLSKKDARANLSAKINKSLENKFVFGSIGRLAYQKNYEFLINIFPEILKIKPDIQLLIFGDGPNAQKYQEMIKSKKLDNNIYLLGSHDEAYKFIKGFDLFVLPSRYEGMSITLIEALFAGSAILASEVGGNKEMLLEKGSEQNYKLNDEENFIEKFKILYNSKEKIREIGNYNKKISSNYSIKNTAQRYYEIYKK